MRPHFERVVDREFVSGDTPQDAQSKQTGTAERFPIQATC